MFLINVKQVYKIKNSEVHPGLLFFPTFASCPGKKYFDPTAQRKIFVSYILPADFLFCLDCSLALLKKWRDIIWQFLLSCFFS